MEQNNIEEMLSDFQLVVEARYRDAGQMAKRKKTRIVEFVELLQKQLSERKCSHSDLAEMYRKLQKENAELKARLDDNTLISHKSDGTN